MQWTVEVSADRPEQDKDYIWDQLYKFNLRFTEPDQHALLNVFARNTHGEPVAGLLGKTFWGWLYINIFWVHADYRHVGLGS